MTETRHHGDGQAAPHQDNPAVSHERQDVSARLVVWVGVGLVVFAALAYVAIWFEFRHFSNTAARNQEAESLADPWAVREGTRGVEERIEQITAPRLEGLQLIDSRDPLAIPGQVKVERHRKWRAPADDRALREYGWVDADKKIVRIPVNDAMRLMLEEKRFKTQEKAK